MTLHFAHALPFVAQVELRPQAATTRVTVEFSSAASEDFRRAEAHVQVWLVGAALGMGAGRRVAARWMQGALDVARLISVGDGEPHPSAVSFTAAVSPFELSYINVLVSKLFTLSSYFKPVRHLLVSAPSAGNQLEAVRVAAGARTCLPALRQPPFPYEFEEASGNEGLFITVRFEQAPSAGQASFIVEACMTWAAQCMQGGYLGTLQPTEFFCQAEEPEVYGAELEWDIPYAQLDLAALHGLLHFFEALHRGGLRVTNFSIR